VLKARNDKPPGQRAEEVVEEGELTVKRDKEKGRGSEEQEKEKREDKQDHFLRSH
jgi:hypothetical protein